MKTASRSTWPRSHFCKRTLNHFYHYIIITSSIDFQIKSLKARGLRDGWTRGGWMDKREINPTTNRDLNRLQLITSRVFQLHMYTDLALFPQRITLPSVLWMPNTGPIYMLVVSLTYRAPTLSHKQTQTKRHNTHFLSSPVIHFSMCVTGDSL